MFASVAWELMAGEELRAMKKVAEKRKKKKKTTIEKERRGCHCDLGEDKLNGYYGLRACMGCKEEIEQWKKDRLKIKTA